MAPLNAAGRLRSGQVERAGVLVFAVWLDTFKQLIGPPVP